MTKDEKSSRRSHLGSSPGGGPWNDPLALMVPGYSLLVRRSRTARGLALGVLTLAGLGTRDGRAQQAEENRRRAVTFAEARAAAERSAPDVTLAAAARRRRARADRRGRRAGQPDLTLTHAPGETARLGAASACRCRCSASARPRWRARPTRRGGGSARRRGVARTRRAGPRRSPGSTSGRRRSAPACWPTRRPRTRAWLATIADERFKRRLGAARRRGADRGRSRARPRRRRVRRRRGAGGGRAARARDRACASGVDLRAAGRPGSRVARLGDWRALDATLRRAPGAAARSRPGRGRRARTCGPSSGCAGRWSTPSWPSTSTTRRCRRPT